MTQLSVTFNQAHNLITRTLKANLVPYLRSSPGVGKSDLARQIAKHFKLILIDLRLSQLEPTDLMGLPDVSGDRATYKPFDIFPLVGDKVPEGFNGWLLFLDEFSSASRSVQAAAYKLLLDHEVGMAKLHPQCFKMAAGNRMDDGAIVNEMSTATQSRLIHLDLRVDLEEWLKWAATAQIDTRITAYLTWKGETALQQFKADHTGLTYACPRTWHFASRILKDTTYTPDLLPLIAGTIGEGAAVELLGFCDVINTVIQFKDILANPTGIAMPSKASHLFAIAHNIVAGITPQNADDVMDFVNRKDFPKEYQFFVIRSAYAQDRSLDESVKFEEWVQAHIKLLM